MSEFPVNATIFNTDPSWTAAQAVAEFNKWLTATKQLPWAQTPEDLTIATGAIAPTRSMVIVDTEAAAASDDLTTILTSTMHDGAVVMLIAANAGRAVNVVHGVGAGGIELLGGANRALSTNAWLLVRRSGTRWVECVCCSAVPTGPLGDDSVAPASTAFVAQEIMDAEINHYPGYNYIINGNFDIWQRGTSQTTSGYGSADRWACDNYGTTNTASQQSFTLGQTNVPDNPKYYMRHVVNSVAGVNNHCVMIQRIEHVKTLAGKTATLSFWAKAGSNKNIAIEFFQTFGTGGTPSSFVPGIGPQLVALTTSWKKYTVTVDIPSIAGKTLGTDGNDCLIVYFWFDAGSTYATRAANLGQQSGTFDIANISLVEGDIDVKPIPRSYGEGLALCQRYYEVGSGETNFPFHPVAATTYKTESNCFYSFKVTKRTVPTISYTTLNMTGVSYIAGLSGIRFMGTANMSGAGLVVSGFMADAEL